MEYIHVRNLEKYHPGYKDRTLQWAKIYINMAEGDPDTELIINEIDWARLIKMILLELRAQKPLPNLNNYWLKKGFDIKKRPMSNTLEVLHNFIDTVTEDLKERHVDKIREDKDKSREDMSGKPDLKAPILYLNEKAKRNFDPKNKANLDLIKARFNEGRTIEDFKKVIDKKVKSWLIDDKMMMYLRPETLFNRSKFESYLNEPEITEQDAFKKKWVTKKE